MTHSAIRDWRNSLEQCTMCGVLKCCPWYLYDLQCAGCWSAVHGTFMTYNVRGVEVLSMVPLWLTMCGVLKCCPWYLYDLQCAGCWSAVHGTFMTYNVRGVEVLSMVPLWLEDFAWRRIVYLDYKCSFSSSYIHRRWERQKGNGVQISPREFDHYWCYTLHER